MEQQAQQIESLQKQIQDLQTQVQDSQRQTDELRMMVYKNRFSNLYVFDTPVKFRSGIDLTDSTIKCGNTTGLKIGTTAGATGDKVGFFGVTPKIQHGNIPEPSGGTTVDSVARTAIIRIISTLYDYGLTA